MSSDREPQVAVKASGLVIEPGAQQIVVTDPAGPYSEKLSEHFSGEKAKESIQLVSGVPSHAVPTLLKQTGPCVVIAHAPGQQDLVKVVTLLKLLKASPIGRYCRVVVSIGFTGEAMALLEERLRMYGCDEVLSDKINGRALVFKIERHVRALPPKRQKKEREENGKEGESARDSNRYGYRRRSEEDLEPELREVAPLKIQSDCWLTVGGNSKRVSKRWMIRMTGPGPAAGRWVELDTESGTERSWRWSPAVPESDPFIKEPGVWVFRGQRTPVFVGELWTFVGVNPSLGFEQEGIEPVLKFFAKGRILSVARDSENAQSLLPAIRETFNAKIRDYQQHSDEDEEGRKFRESLGAEQDWRDALFEVDAPLELESDCWLIADWPKGKPAAVSDRRVLQLVGPPKAAGSWVKRESANQDPELQTWEWVPSSDKDPYIKEEGGWFYQGLKPTYERGFWIFAGKAPRLSFDYDGQSYGTKIDFRGETLVLSGDSEAAKKALAPQEEQIKREVRTEREYQRHVGEDGADAEELELALKAAEEGEELSATEAKQEEREINDRVDQEKPGESAEDFRDRTEEKENELRGEFQQESAREKSAASAGETKEEAEAATRTPEQRAKEAALRFAEYEHEREGFREYRIPQNVIGAQGGSWDHVREEGDSGSLYVYVPVQLLNHAISETDQLSELAPFWCFTGSPAPRLMGLTEAIWVFRQNPPLKFVKFEDLQSFVQEHLKKYLEAAAAIQKVAELKLAAEQMERKIWEAAEKAGAPIEKEVVEELARSAARAVERGREKKAEAAAAAASSPDQSEAGSSPNVTENDGSGATVESSGKRVGANEVSDSADQNAASASAQAAEKIGSPQEPGLPPLALAFLISEVVSMKGLQVNDMARKYCRYLHQSCGMENIELWCRAGSDWRFVVMTKEQGETPAHDAEWFNELEKGTPAAETHQARTLIRGPKGEILGALIFEGPDAAKIPADYLNASADLIRGVVSSVQQQEAAA